jgi:guanine nucleotide-binding protein alpha-1 subunit
MAGSGETEATHLRAPPKPVFQEIAINSTTPWKHAFNRLIKTERTSFDSQDGVDWDDPEDPGAVLHACSQDMIHIWSSPVIQELLGRQNVRLEESSGL